MCNCAGTRALSGACLSILLLTACVHALAQSDLEDRFRAEYHSAAERLRSSSARFRCEGTFEVKDIGKHKGRLQHRALFANEDSQLSIENYKSMGGNPVDATVVYCLTKDYFFQLERSSHNEPYALKNLVRNPTAANSPMGLVHFDFIAKAAFTLGGVPVAEIMDRPSFSIVRVSDVSEKRDASEAELEFKCSDPTIWIIGGTMRFAPSLDWALTGYDVEVSPNGRMTKGLEKGFRLQGRVGCARWPSGHVFPRSVEFRFVPPANREALEPLKYFSVDEVQFVNVPQSQFKLSAFGLPDSALEPPRVYGRRNLTWTIAGAGLLLLGVGGGLRLILKRLGKKGDAPRSPGDA